MLRKAFDKAAVIAQLPISADTEGVAEIIAEALREGTISLEGAWHLLNVDVQRQPDLVVMVLGAAEKKKWSSSSIPRCARKGCRP